MIGKVYLGDGCYGEWDHGMLKLTTSDGISDTNTIYLEDFVIEALQEYLKVSARAGGKGSIAEPAKIQ